jgi:hypothetical protein
MIEQLANYASIIMALAMVNVVFQLDKASKMIASMNKFLNEGASDNE